MNTKLNRLYFWLEQVQIQKQIMSEWYDKFTPKEHIEINKLENDIKKEIRKELWITKI